MVSIFGDRVSTLQLTNLKDVKENCKKCLLALPCGLTIEVVKRDWSSILGNRYVCEVLVIDGKPITEVGIFYEKDK